jgi:serine/threonine protein kinase
MPLNGSNSSELQSIGNYDVIEKIAEGGMGTIYKGRNRDSGQIVALKVVPSTMAKNPVLLKRFEQEFRAAQLLDHPNIVRALEYDGSGSSPFLVMEFVDGESLGQRIERAGPIPEPEAIRIMAQVAQALHRAHKQGLIHRDIKPDNIMVTTDGQVKVADLGLVKEIEADLNLTRTGRGLGTPHFMAPEQFRNAKNADARCDIYSMGATLYMMVTGELPFKSCGPLEAWMKKIHNEITPPRKLNPQITERTDWAIRRAMHATPDERPATCREFIEDLTGKSARKPPEEAAASQDIWYLVYRDDQGQTHTVKGTTEGIRRSLREGLLGDASNIRASRAKAGPFELVRSYAEFRDLIVTAEPTSPAKPGTSSGLRRPPSTATTGPAGKTSSKAETPAAPAADVSDSAPVPHIHLGVDQPNTEWVKWVFLALVALGTAVVGVLLFK